MERINYERKTMKKLMTLVFVLFCTSAIANPVENTFNKVSIWASEEKAKTIAFQKKGWADGKAQLAKTWNDITNLFNWTK